MILSLFKVCATEFLLKNIGNLRNNGQVEIQVKPFCRPVRRFRINFGIIFKYSQLYYYSYFGTICQQNIMTRIRYVSNNEVIFLR